VAVCACERARAFDKQFQTFALPEIARGADATHRHTSFLPDRHMHMCE